MSAHIHTHCGQIAAASPTMARSSDTRSPQKEQVTSGTSGTLAQRPPRKVILARVSEPKDDKPWSTRSPEGPWDWVVVGSGMGGMACAAMLSELGRKVLVLEQHYVPGGFTQTFHRADPKDRALHWTWDVGVHAVGEVVPKALLGRILGALSRGTLAWASLGEVYDEFHFPDLELGFPSDRARFRETLVDTFPAEEAAIDAYLQKTREVAGAMGRYYLSRLLPPQLAPLGARVIARDAHAFLAETTAEVLSRIGASPRLRSVLTAQWGYYGVEPKRSSFAIHALVARHFFHGGYYPVGGSAAIARALLGTVAANGGWTRVKADVARVTVERGRATGVELAGGERIGATRGVISAIGAIATAERLLAAPEREAAWARSIARLRPTPCHVCLYLGFAGDIRDAGASAANKWFYETWSEDEVTWDPTDPQREAPILYTSFPSLKDPAHDPGPRNLHTGEVVTFVPWELLERFKGTRWHRRGEEYEAIKRDWEQRMLRQLLRHMPGLERHLRWVELSTPISTEHFTRAPRGAIYGIEPTPERYANPYLRPRTPVTGLLLTGGDMTSVGVMGAFGGGVLSAASAEPVRAARWLRGVVGR
jgi:all-trans-retinol 13,14-reductase